MNRTALLELKQADRLLNWIIAKRDQGHITPEQVGGNPTGRFALWLGVGVDKSAGLQRHDQWTPFDAGFIPDWLQRLGAVIGCDPGAHNSILIYLYPEGVGIGRHVDKPIYAGEVTMLHLCRDTSPQELSLFDATDGDGRDSTAFLWGMQRSPKPLYHGEAVRFNARVEHGVAPVPRGMVRATIQFRNVLGGNA